MMWALDFQLNSHGAASCRFATRMPAAYGLSGTAALKMTFRSFIIRAINGILNTSSYLSVLKVLNEIFAVRSGVVLAVVGC